MVGRAAASRPPYSEHSTTFPLPQENRKRTRRDTPPGVSGPRCKQKGQVKISAFPNALPRGEGGPRRGSGEEFGQESESQYKQTDLLKSRSAGGGLQISLIVRLPPAFLISHQSVPKSRLATASPPGEAMGASRQMVFDSEKSPSNFGGAFEVWDQQ